MNAMQEAIIKHFESRMQQLETEPGLQGYYFIAYGREHADESERFSELLGTDWRDLSVEVLERIDASELVSDGDFIIYMIGRIGHKNMTDKCPHSFPFYKRKPV